MTTDRTEAPQSRRSTRTLRPLVERLHEPSPPPHRPEATQSGSGSPDACPDPVRAVEHLAACGLTVAEVAAHLRLNAPDSAIDSEALAAAFQRGRVEGIATIKQARFRNAVEGGSTAQKDMLALLTHADHPPAEEDITVVRSVIGGPYEQG